MPLETFTPGIKKVLFVTWDGPEVNYLENLFAPIFSGLQREYGYQFHIFQFTWATPEKIRDRKIFFERLDTPYTAIRLSGEKVLIDLFKARYWHIWEISRYIKNHNISIIMPRAVTSLFLVKSLLKKHRLKLVWDADGFPLDERVDFSGLSPMGLRYRFFRDQEFQGFYLSRSLICRSARAKEIIRARAGSGFAPSKVFVINNGIVDSKEEENSIWISPINEIRLIYVGSSGPQYLIPNMLTLLQALVDEIPELRVSILTYQTAEVNQLVTAQFPALKPYLLIKSVSPEEIPSALKSACIGIAFREPTFSMEGVAPIKIAEYLAAGLSILYSPGTGDLDQLLANQLFAFSLNVTEKYHIEALVRWIKDQASGINRPMVRQFAKEKFGLEHTVGIYHQALQHGEA